MYTLFTHENDIDVSFPQLEPLYLTIPPSHSILSHSEEVNSKSLPPNDAPNVENTKTERSFTENFDDVYEVANTYFNINLDQASISAYTKEMGKK